VAHGGLRRQGQRRVLAPQHAEQPAQLVQRLAPRRLDRAEGLARGLRARQREPAGDGRLHGHRAQRVRDHVVQLARDPRALVGHRVASHHAAKCDVRLPVCPRTQERSRVILADDAPSSSC
jgi:hypothetical protein